MGTQTESLKIALTLNIAGILCACVYFTQFYKQEWEEQDLWCSVIKVTLQRSPAHIIFLDSSSPIFEVIYVILWEVNAVYNVRCNLQLIK